FRPDRLIIGGGGKGGSIPFTPGIYRSVKRIVVNNIIYIANLAALMNWYVHVRSLLISDDFSEPLFVGLKDKLSMAIKERVKQFQTFCRKMPASIEAYQDQTSGKASPLLLGQKQELFENLPEFNNYFTKKFDEDGDHAHRDAFLNIINLAIRKTGKDYISVIQSLGPKEAASGTLWLQGIVDQISADIFRIFPSISPLTV
ncbi:hypothetical protein ACFLZM_08055, partial [Thermodesulfobacteriota bacterium]